MLRFFLLVILSFAVNRTLAQVRFEYDFNRNGESAEIANPIQFDGRIFYTAYTNPGGRSIFVFDPATGKNEQVFNQDGDILSEARNFLVVGDYLIFLNRVNSSSILHAIERGKSYAEERFGRTAFEVLSQMTTFQDEVLLFANWGVFRIQPATAELEKIYPELGNNPQTTYLGKDENYAYFSAEDTETDHIEFFRTDGVSTEQISDFRNSELVILESLAYENHLVMKKDGERELHLYDLTTNELSIDSTMQLYPSYIEVRPFFQVFNDDLYIKINPGNRNTIVRYAVANRQVDSSFQVRPKFQQRWQFEVVEDQLFAWNGRTNRDAIDSFFVYSNLGDSLVNIPALNQRMEQRPYQYHYDNFLAPLNGKIYASGSSMNSGFELASYDQNDTILTAETNLATGTFDAAFQKINRLDSDRLIVSGTISTLSTSGIADPQIALYTPQTQSATDLTALNAALSVNNPNQFFVVDSLLFLGQMALNNGLFGTLAVNIQTGELTPVDTSAFACSNNFGPFVSFNEKVYFFNCPDFTNLQSLKAFTPGTPYSTVVAGSDSLNLHVQFIRQPSPTMTTIGDTLYFVEGDRFAGQLPTLRLLSMDQNEQLDTVDLNGIFINDRRFMPFSDRILYQNQGFDWAQYKPGEGASMLEYDGQVLSDIDFNFTTIENDTALYFTEQDRIYSMNKATDAISLFLDVSTNATMGYPLENPELKLLDSGTIYLSLYTGNRGDNGLYREPFRLDLATQELQLLADIHPTNSSFPDYFVQLNDRIYFAADDDYRGEELWSHGEDCFTLDFSFTDIDTLNETGSATAIPQGGTPPFTYRWSNGDTTRQITNLNAGFIEVTVTDSNGCSASANGWISTPPFILTNVAEPNAAHNKILLFPNPTTDRLTIQFERPLAHTAVLQLFAADGRLELTQNGSITTDTQLSIGHLPQGIHYLRIYDPTTGAAYVQKVVLY